MSKQPEGLFLAELLEQAAGDYTAWDKQTGYAAAAELRRLHAENEALRAGEAFHKVAVQQRDSAWMENEALHKANEAFGKRQEWWNERMFELEKQRDELLEALEEIVDASDADEWNGVSTMKARAAIARAEGKQ